MELASINQAKINSNNLLINDVELKNGHKTQMVTVFNNLDFDMQNMMKGIDFALPKMYSLKSFSKSQSHNSDIKFKNLLISEVELRNGKKSDIVILFNTNELDFEVVNISVNYALEQMNHIKSSHNKVMTIKPDKQLALSCEFFKHDNE